MLLNPIYKGTLVNHKYEIEDFLTGKQISLPPEEHLLHERPEWAIVSPEVFQKAQEIMVSRRSKYDSGEAFREARYSSKHVFSTLIKCAHCGRSFTRKSYTYKNTRIYWRCVTNDQYTAERCDNNVVLNEPDLVQVLKQYFISLITDKEAFISGVLESFQQKIPKNKDPVKTQQDMETKRKKLLSKKERYQEMYANDLITLSELKAKLSSIAEELKTVDTNLEQIGQAARIHNHTETAIRRYTEEILQFLELETITSQDMRRVLDHICVNRDGNVRIVLKKLEDMERS